jgi:hypothetical protein
MATIWIIGNVFENSRQTLSLVLTTIKWPQFNCRDSDWRKLQLAVSVSPAMICSGAFLVTLLGIMKKKGEPLGQLQTEYFDRVAKWGRNFSISIDQFPIFCCQSCSQTVQLILLEIRYEWCAAAELHLSSRRARHFEGVVKRHEKGKALGSDQKPLPCGPRSTGRSKINWYDQWTRFSNTALSCRTHSAIGHSRKQTAPKQRSLGRMPVVSSHRFQLRFEAVLA